MTMWNSSGKTVSRLNIAGVSLLTGMAVAIGFAIAMETSTAHSAMPVIDAANLRNGLCDAQQTARGMRGDTERANMRQFVVSLELTDTTGAMARPMPAIVLNGVSSGGGGEVSHRALPVETVSTNGTVTTRTLEAKVFCTGYRYLVSTALRPDGRVDIDIRLLLGWFEGEPSPQSHRTSSSDLKVTLGVGDTLMLQNQAELPRRLKSVKVSLDELKRSGRAPCQIQDARLLVQAALADRSPDVARNLILEAQRSITEQLEACLDLRPVTSAEVR
jgi:hypothetical protein